MPSPHDLLSKATQLQHAGDWAAAEQLYGELFRQQPDAELAHRLGILAYQQHRRDDALGWFRQALALAPGRADLHCNLGLVLNELLQLTAAEAALRFSLSLKGDQPQAWNNLGNTLAAQGRLTEAEPLYQRSLTFEPSNADAWNNLGVLYQKMRRWPQSRDCFERALLYRPGMATAACNLGLTWRQLRQPAAAEQAFQLALQLRPHDAAAYRQLGALRLSLGDLPAAIGFLQAALHRDPTSLEAWIDLGRAWDGQGQVAAAIECYQRALQQKADCVEALRNLGATLLEAKEYPLALAVLRRADQLQPGYVDGPLISVLQILCQWESLEALQARIVAVIDGDDGDGAASPPVEPLVLVSLPFPLTQTVQTKGVARYVRAAGLDQPLASVRSPSLVRRRRPLKIGLVSADFREHPVGYLLPEWIEALDRRCMQPVAYSIGHHDQSPLRARLEGVFEEFIDVQALAPQAIAERIARDEVDILIDLQGHTRHARTAIFAHRPAPIQVAYLGYAGTTGTPFIDYLLADRWVIPAEQREDYSEKVIWLPGCFLVQDSHIQPASESPSRASLELPEGAFVFCGFSSSYKISPLIFQSWLRILRAVPEGVLWLRRPPAMAEQALRQAWLEAGLEAKRLIFAPNLAWPAHLARHRAADLFLDTFPYNQHSTASHAMRVGLPLLTLSGATFASRVAGSLLHALHLPELISDSFADYERLAIELATDRQRLQALRERLEVEAAGSDIFRGEAFARKSEQAFQRMWERHLKGLPPTCFEVEGPPAGEDIVGNHQPSPKSGGDTR
jgi:protein O-GlcNAc transferase